MLRDYASAEQSAAQALLENPENADAILVAAQIAAEQGDHPKAIELCSSVDPESRLGIRAVELHCKQMLQMDRIGEATEVLLAAIAVRPEVIEWRHQAWALLNRLGRRDEASQHASALCRTGLATEPEMHSLIRRSEAFPRKLNEGEQPSEFFEPGLGMARWFSTQEDYPRALEELRPVMQGQQQPSAAAKALYGRLLAETQAFDEFPAWQASCDEETQAFGDYWTAMGTFFYDQREFQASARALLEAIYRNPTDRLTYQRLSRVFNTLQQPEQAFRFRQRGIKIYETENMSTNLLETDDPIHRRDLAKHLQDMMRPFEVLQWTLLNSTLAPTEGQTAGVPSQETILGQIETQRNTLLQMKEAYTAASEAALAGLSRDNFPLRGGLELLANAPQKVPDPTEGEIDLLTQPRLVNRASEVGLDFQWYQDVEINLASIPIHESVGGGIAAVDYDLDGWPDVYLAQGSGDPPTNQCTRSNVLFRNLSGRFFEVTELSNTGDRNYSSGLAAGDVNQDGFPDLWLGSLGHNRLLVNNGDGTFREATESLGQFEDLFSTSLAIADINGDTLPDLFETNYIVMDGAFALPKKDADGNEILPGPLDHVAELDRWFENLGDGSFRIHKIDQDVADRGTSLGIIVTDMDNDGSNEVFVGNDVRGNHLLVHTGNNQMVNTADAKGVARGFNGIANGCMGIAAADFNRDGLLDLHITNFFNESANLYVQSSGDLFADYAIRYDIDRLSKPMVGFGTKAIDVDRNGWTDLLVTNGHIFDTQVFGDAQFQMPPQMLMSRGRRFELTTVEDESGYWEGLYLGRAMTTIDYDRNGSTDVLIGHLDQPLALLDNETDTAGNWLQLDLVGTVSERDAIGARVVVTVGEDSFTQWMTAGDGYFSSDEPFLDFGLGTGGNVGELDVFWPSGDRQTFKDVPLNQRYLIVEGESELISR